MPPGRCKREVAEEKITSYRLPTKAFEPSCLLHQLLVSKAFQLQAAFVRCWFRVCATSKALAAFVVVEAEEGHYFPW